MAVSLVAVIGAALFAWHGQKVRANELKLAEDARVCRVSAEQGDPKAQSKLGHMYSHGQGVSQNYAEAVRWYRKAADQGDPEGQYGLASMYYYGRGVPQDYTDAFHWYRKSADQGDAGGEDGLAIMYLRGQGVPQDYAQALRWYRKAADQGYARAQNNLGNMYYYGRGVPPDRAEADRWYHKAADQGDEYAQRALGLRGQGLSIRLAISVSLAFLASWIVFKDVILPPPDTDREPQPRILTMAGLCGLAWTALSLYGVFGVFHSVLTANAFRFVETLVGGLTMGLLITVFGPKSAKVALWVVVILLVGNDVIVISRHDLSRFVVTIRGFTTVNGSLIGIAVPLAIFLWQTGKRHRGK